MEVRISCVGRLNLVRMIENGTANVGDALYLRPVLNAIAVQREKADFYAHEFQFKDFAIFSRPLVKPSLEEKVRMSRVNLSPILKAEEIHVLILSAGGILQIGSCGELRAESRLKHIRHLLRESPPQSR